MLISQSGVDVIVTGFLLYEAELIFYNVFLKFKQTEIILISKCKAIPLQAWTGCEGFRSLRLPDFKTVGT
jgi:hypothetical protein